MLSLIYFNYHLLFPVIGQYLSSISSYLVSINSQHKVTIIVLGRQFTILLCQMLEALGQARTITDVAFVLVLEHNTTLNTDKTSRCVYYSCSPHLSRTGSYYQCIKTDQNKSGPYLDLHAAVTTHEQYNILYSLQCYNSTTYDYIKLYTTIHDKNNAITYKKSN